MTAELLDASVALRAEGLLRRFNQAGVLAPSDVHVACRLARLGGEEDETVVLAVALAVRGPRFGHVRTDLATVAATAAADVEDDVDVSALEWPEPATWVDRVAASPLVATSSVEEAKPLWLDGTFIYLDRYWRDEAAVAADLLTRAQAESGGAVDETALASGIARLFPDGGEQALAAAAAVLARLTVIAGGPGTGKTTTIVRIAALLEEQAAADGRPPLIALAAPTGKAANRMTEAVRQECSRLPVDLAVNERLGRLTASTIHRLLRRDPGNASRFRHNRNNRLPHDVVIVDETSMVPLALMARLTEAVRPDARLMLVGDPEQLASVEAGAVLGDIVGPALTERRMRPGTAAALSRVAGVPVEHGADGGPAIGDRIVTPSTNHRFSGMQAALAAAVRQNDPERAAAALAAGDPALTWLPVDPVTADPAALAPVRDAVLGAGGALIRAALDGDPDAPRAAVAELARFRLLCAHRRGPAGVGVWTARVEDWLAAGVDGFVPDGEWYAGRPVIATTNDYSLRLFNGDTGIVVARPDGGLDVAFGLAHGVVTFAPARLAGIDSVYAMTVHKAQGSEFDEAVVILPGPESRILTRELLYTAITRARRRLIVVGTEESVAAAIARPVARSSGLGERLWGRP